MREIAIISGKGGTGKTTLTLSILPFLDNFIIADCDVDAPDLKVILGDEITASKDFIGFQRPVIDKDKCIHCNLCYNHCNFNAITPDITLKSNACEGCSVCELVCPVDAITMEDYVIGKIYNRNTPFGKMIDARLIPGEESSGKLVSEVRKLAKSNALELSKDLIVIDGSPGIACNVIATITGTTKAIIVTEPTISGLHDLRKVLALTKSLSVPCEVVINKYDLSMEKTKEIESFCYSEGVQITLKIPFDKRIVESTSQLKIASIDDIPFFKSDEWGCFIDRFKNL